MQDPALMFQQQQLINQMWAQREQQMLKYPTSPQDTGFHPDPRGGRKGQSELNLRARGGFCLVTERANFNAVLALKIKGKIAFQPNQGLTQNVPPKSW